MNKPVLNEELLKTGSYNKIARIWNAVTDEFMGMIALQDSVYTISWNSTNQSLVAIGLKGVVSVPFVGSNSRGL